MDVAAGPLRAVREIDLLDGLFLDEYSMIFFSVISVIFLACFIHSYCTTEASRIDAYRALAGATALSLLLGVSTYVFNPITVLRILSERARDEYVRYLTTQ